MYTAAPDSYLIKKYDDDDDDYDDDYDDDDDDDEYDLIWFSD